MKRCQHLNLHHSLSLGKEPPFWVCRDCGATSDDGDELAKFAFVAALVVVALVALVVILLRGAP